MVFKRNKPGPARSKPGGGILAKDSLVCIHCHIRVKFGGPLPYTEYEKHLRNIHNIQFEMRSIIDRTLLLQRPNMLLEKRADAKVQVDLEHNAEKISITTTKPYSFEKESKNGTTTIIPMIDEKHSTDTSSIKNIGPKMDDKIIEVAEKQQIPWFAGCEYQCLYDYCGTMFFYNQDLRSHIKKEHEDPDFYLDKYKVFETKAENIACKECNLEIKRNFSSVFGHLRDHHDGMTIEDYQKKHKMKEYVKNYTVSKRLKFESQASLNDNTNGCHTPSSSNVELPSPKSSKIVPPSKIFNSSALDFDPPKDQPWYNGQEYQCQICQKLYYEVNKLLFHIRNSHNLTGKPYQKKFGKFETKKAFYICKLCFNKVKHTKNGIQNHLMQDHDGMGINSYQEVFHPDAKQLANNAKLAPNGTNSTSSSTDGSSITQSQSQLLDSEAIFKKWSTGTCVFQCEICLFSSGGSVEFWKHIKHEHDMEIQAYKDAHKNPCIVMNKITCVLCTKVLRYDYGTLLGHASTKHNMKLMDFYEKFYKEEMEAAERQLYVTNSEPEMANESEHIEEEESSNGIIEEESSIITGGRYMAMDDLGKRTQAWAWKCQYRCGICNMRARSRVGAQKHINKAHECSIKEYEANYGSPLTKKVIHSCMICQKKVLHDPSCLSYHVKCIHKITLIDYFKKYIEKMSASSAHPKMSKNKNFIKVRQGKMKSNSYGKILKKISRIKKFKPSGNEPHYKWANNAAEYKCKACDTGYVTKVKNTMYNHLNSVHKMDAKTYIATYGKLSETTRRHQCRICGGSIVWHALNIIQHLKIHKEMNLSLKQYYEQYICGREDSIYAPIEDQTNSSTTTSISGSSSIHTSLQMSGTNFLEEEEEIVDPNHWMNRCLFQCGVCAEQFDSKSNFKSHLEVVHSTNFNEDYLNNYGDPTIMTNLHGCLMCQEMIICDAEDISEHLNIAHALSLEDYHDRFIANDRTVATAKKPPSNAKTRLCRNWNQESQIHTCLICSLPFEFKQEVLENHMNKNHGIDLRTYEKRFRHELDTLFDDILIYEEDFYENNGGADNNRRHHDEVLDDDDDFGSVFEDDDEQQEAEVIGDDGGGFERKYDPLRDENHDAATDHHIQHIDTENNIDFIPDEDTGSRDFQFHNSEFEGSVVNTEDGRKSCTFCGMTFSTLSNAQRHFRNQHTNTERIPCNLCQRTFKNSHSHNEHLRINHGITQSMLKAQPLIAEATS